MRVLELFKGTGSVTKYCSQHAEYEVVSLDIDPQSEATHTCNILDWDYTAYPKGHFDIVWASPPCTEYSTMLFRRARRLEEADSIVQKVLEIIRYYEPQSWFIENPFSGLLKKRVFMRDIPYVVVSYCRYGYAYQKHTCIWTNALGFVPKRCRFDCDALENGKHQALVIKTRSLATKHSIPQPLIQELLEEAREMCPLAHRLRRYPRAS